MGVVRGCTQCFIRYPGRGASMHRQCGAIYRLSTVSEAEVQNFFHFIYVGRFESLADGHCSKITRARLPPLRCRIHAITNQRRQPLPGRRGFPIGRWLRWSVFMPRTDRVASIAHTRVPARESHQQKWGWAGGGGKGMHTPARPRGSTGPAVRGAIAAGSAVTMTRVPCRNMCGRGRAGRRAFSIGAALRVDGD
jgi:hypothetical protein